MLGYRWPFLPLGLAVALCGTAFGSSNELSGSSPITTVPNYVLDYAPMVYLYSGEAYLPADLTAQLTNTHPVINVSTPVTGAPSPLTLNNLNQLNAIGGTNIYLNANDDFTKNPPWLFGVKPDAQGKTQNAVSSQIILHDKGHGTVDVFYFYFYAFNQGDKILDVGYYLGDHVGDIEHNMIRFKNGTPSAIWFSQHQNGAAYTYEAVAKEGRRPVDYSANGTHANWATSGTHDHTIPDVILPQGFLVDYTNNGTYWDPILSAYYYTVTFPNNTNGDNSSPTFAALPNPYNASAGTPVNWLYFEGQFGNDQLPTNDPEQHNYLDIGFEYTAGPNGPMYKQLNRVNVCPDNGYDCIVRTHLIPGS